ncbi:hypothetical protein QBC32DRAFT_392042 [Pseudoneurospora amorphoporcata]|uniref:C2H2-type domain-containing protein n=1 Tax=Pseudoneurospora amorphoporcata TaxID=241081 RepID=A0AAN6NT84_9PEZI|nr:hypothetical protein QBC32DRAFT_392042 [Pseudoneurospora amorphoporcata]
MSQHPNHDGLAGSSPGQQQQGNGDEQNIPPLLGNFDFQDPNFQCFEQPSTTTFDDPTGWSFDGRPSQPGGHLQYGANTSAIFPNQYNFDMSFYGTGMANLAKTSPSNTFLPMNGTSQPSGQPVVQPDWYGDFDDPVSGGAMGAGQIAGNNQDAHLLHQQLPPGNYVPKPQPLHSNPILASAAFTGQQQLGLEQNSSASYQQTLAQTAGETGPILGKRKFDASQGNKHLHTQEPGQKDSQKRHMAGSDGHGQVLKERGQKEALNLQSNVVASEGSPFTGEPFVGSFNVEGQHDDKASGSAETAEAAEHDTPGHPTEDRNVGFVADTAGVWKCVTCEAGFITSCDLSTHRTDH